MIDIDIQISISERSSGWATNYTSRAITIIKVTTIITHQQHLVTWSIPFLNSSSGKVWLMMSSMGSSPAAIIEIAWKLIYQDCYRHKAKSYSWKPLATFLDPNALRQWSTLLCHLTAVIICLVEISDFENYGENLVCFRTYDTPITFDISSKHRELHKPK